MPVTRNTPKADKFNQALDLPYELRLRDFESAIQDVYDFFFDVNKLLLSIGAVSKSTARIGST